MRRLALVLAALALAGCGGGVSDGDEPDAGQSSPQLTDLTSVEQFAGRFNADQGVPRLVVLVAPT